MKNFNDIYEKIYRESNEQLEKLRKESLYGYITFLVVIIIAIIIIFKLIYLPGIWIVYVIGAIIVFAFLKKPNTYNSIFKQKVIANFVKEYSKNLDYKPARGISRMEYYNSKFENFDKFYSEDLIYGTLDNGYSIKMSEVKTEREEIDSEGHRRTYTIFHGLFGIVKMNKSINGSIKIMKNGIYFNNKYKIKMDSGEFEKKFEVFATDKIQVMQILTSDIMQMLVDFKNNNKLLPELIIDGSIVNIRFPTGNVFEAKLIKSALDYEALKKYYDVINFTLELIEKFVDNIKETEI